MRFNHLIGFAATVAGASFFTAGCAGSMANEGGGAPAALTACGTPVVPEAEMLALDSKMALAIEGHPPTSPINVYFHVLNDGPATANGNVPQQWIDDQIDVLNLAYAQHGYTFNLVVVDRTTNVNWFNMGEGTPQENQAAKALHQGTAIDLNIYSVNSSTVLGWSSYPWKRNLDRPWKDNVVVGYNTLPGGSQAGYDQGDTLVHEVGHWLGLYHTFEFGCGDRRSDKVGDTPQEASGAVGCPVGRDTCVDDPGLDPVNNLMDTSDDLCRTGFTAKQKRRMDRLWVKFREGN
jgi:Pregnancy-associated plasma protein-A